MTEIDTITIQADEQTIEELKERNDMMVWHPCMLSEAQMDVLRIAYDMGHYEDHRSVTFKQMALKVDKAPSTTNELLRRAERKIVREYLKTVGEE